MPASLSAFTITERFGDRSFVVRATGLPPLRQLYSAAIYDVSPIERLPAVHASRVFNVDERFGSRSFRVAADSLADLRELYNAAIYDIDELQQTRPTGTPAPAT